MAKKPLKNLVGDVLRQLEQEGCTEKGIKKHFRTYSALISYADGIGEKVYSEAIGLAFLKERYGIPHFKILILLGFYWCVLLKSYILGLLLSR